LMTTGIKTWLCCMTKPCKTHRTHARWFVTIGSIRTSATVKRRNGKAILSKSERTTTSERIWAGTASQSQAVRMLSLSDSYRFFRKNHKNLKDIESIRSYLML
jgi:hypothetical protein